MSEDPPSAGQFWWSVAARLAAIVVVGCASVLWFQGCLVPVIKDEVRQDQQKAAGSLDALPGDREQETGDRGQSNGRR